MSSISVFAVGSAVIAPLAVFLPYLLEQPPKVASTSQELLDLFEDRCALLEEHATLTSPNDGGRASERFTIAAPTDLARVNVLSTELSASAEACLVYRIEPERDLHKKQRWESQFARYFWALPPKTAFLNPSTDSVPSGPPKTGQRHFPP